MDSSSGTAAQDQHQSHETAPSRPNADSSDGHNIPTLAAYPQAVRFSSVNQEIEPANTFQTETTETSEDLGLSDEINPKAEADIRNLSRSLHESHLQQRRMSNFAFEPVSLPASRVPSNESSPQNSREPTRSIGPSSRPSSSSMQTPPLTPAGTYFQAGHDEGIDASSAGPAKFNQDPLQMTPQTSSPMRESPPTAAEGLERPNVASSAVASGPSTDSDQISTTPSSVSQGSTTIEPFPRQVPQFSAGPSETSFASSREPSPTSTPGGGSGSATPPAVYSRPFTPAGDRDDPYARSRRPPQPKNTELIDPRFVFGGKDARRRSGIPSAMASTASPPRSNSGSDLKSQEKQAQVPSLHALVGKKDHFGHLHDESSSSLGAKPHGSMAELKRFFRLGISSKGKRSQSPSGTAKGSAKPSAKKSGHMTPSQQPPAHNVPFADDHGLEKKWGKFGKVLGSGAGGSVRLMKRSSDGVTFAVKQFRDRHSYETEREYSKKVTAEFCIGSTLHHGNIIETLDIVHEGGRWFEVMEYAPYDLFAIVMTGKMSREEVACSFLQIVSGVSFLHGMGLAHRDLKLDNVVVNDRGIMKLIDFGSASVFKYPFENDIVLATGIVGSDPYLAPEVYDKAKYDPQPTDIWSLAIIFACMSLRRFPWKAPRLTDNSYKLFVSPPTQPFDVVPRRSSEGRPISMVDAAPALDDPRRASAPHDTQADQERPGEAVGHHHHTHHHHHEKVENSEQTPANENPTPTSSPGQRQDAPGAKQETIRGPWRLLRLLPRESRSIMGRMLEVDPKRRATLEDMMNDAWVTDTPACRQVEGMNIIKAPGHEHTLEPGTAVTPAQTKK